MKRIITVLIAVAIMSPAYAEITNASFEQWDDTQPTDWTTIDSGIEINPESTQVRNGLLAARVTVNTAKQSITDLRQKITIVAGETYDFEVSVMHTDGGVRARLFVDGYRMYADPAITYEWQTLTYSLVADQNRVIDVGLRFYDATSFDGSEDIFVDSFKPAVEDEVPTPEPPASCTEASVSLLTDRYASETSWRLIKGESEIILEGSGFANNTQYQEEDCLDPGEYTFTIDDAYGDGICCQYGAGEYVIKVDGEVIITGGEFERTISHTFTIENNSGGGPLELGEYYVDATDLTGFELKSALYEIIQGHDSQGYGALWRFYSDVELDFYYEEDGSILDIYSENPSGSEPYTFSAITDQCGNYSGEGDCYNREHSFPRNWFGGDREPMNSDVHHIFLSDGYVNSKRGNLPYGEVGSPSFISENGSLAGYSNASSGYSAAVFEPIDEFKGDLARAHFYMATRYQNLIDGWENNSDTSDAALNGSSSAVFEAWYLTLLKSWHQLDPVSQKEIDRNNAAFLYQGNRNPYVDHPEFVFMIWGALSQD